MEKQVALAAATEAGRGQMYGLGALSSPRPHLPGQAWGQPEGRGCLERLQADVRGFRPERGSLGERKGPAHFPPEPHCTSAEKSAGTEGPQDGTVADACLS